MKSLGRIVLAIFAVVVLVAGITFVKQYQVSPNEAPTPPASSPGAVRAAEIKLTFPKGVIWEWQPAKDGEFEQQSEGFKDFLFQNDNSVPVELGLKAKSCKCSEVSVGLLPAADVQRYSSEDASKAGADTAKVQTQKLEVDDLKGVIVAPGDGVVIRLNWKDKKDKEPHERYERLVVDVWAQAQAGGPRTIHKLELPITYVPALRIREDILKLPDLYLNGKETREFKCWSSTRPKFSLTAKERTGDPCFVCSCMPLTDNERQEMEESTKTRVLCGYVVRVTVNERLNDNVQMELGPFGRRIDLKSDPDIEPTSVLVAGVVRGDVTVETDDERGGILLGPFPAKNGITKVVKLTAHRPDLELKLDKVEPDGSTHLKVISLKKTSTPVGGRTKWELTVEVPPGGPSGRLPDHSAVRLTIPGNPPRHIRIPVSGFATQ